MNNSFDIWKMLAGVAFFLLSMNIIEDTLRQLAGRKFKLFLKKQSDSKVKAIGGAAIVTGLLQSSSVVNLLVLSMVGAHVLYMENALALILGANLGTTLGSWIVATIGFSFDIEKTALPAVGIAGLILAFTKREGKIYLWIRFLFGLAFLFVALGYIKNGMEGFVKQTDLTFFSKYPVIVFLFVGLVLTTLVQSSSATIAITLSALYTDAITLYAATAIVLGSEIGTTFKLFLASAGGMANKKRVAFGNFIFNVATVALVFSLLGPINRLITDVLGVQNNLIALVFFQTLVNLVSVLLFFPLLKWVSRMLLKRFPENEGATQFINKVPYKEIEFAIEALENETGEFITLITIYSLDSFRLIRQPMQMKTLHKGFYDKSETEKYNYIKRIHGEMHSFYLKVQNAANAQADTKRLDKLIAAIRNMMYAAKNIRDAQADIQQVRNSSNDIKFNFYSRTRENLQRFYTAVQGLLQKDQNAPVFDGVSALYLNVTKGYSESLQLLYKEGLLKHLSEVEVSTLINFNREVYTSFKSMIFGLKDYLLAGDEGDFFATLPGFIR